MYAIVKTGGKQYKVTKGLIFETELLDAEVNSTVELEVVQVTTLPMPRFPQPLWNTARARRSTSSLTKQRKTSANVKVTDNLTRS